MMLANSSSNLMKFWTGLAERGNELIIVSIHRKGQFISDKIIHIRIHSRFGLGLSYIKLLLNIRRIIRKYKPDVLISHFASTHGIIAYFSGFRPHICMVYGSDIYQTGRLLRFLNQIVFRYSDIIHVTAVAAKRYLLANYDSIPDLGKRLTQKRWGFVGDTFTTMIREEGTPETGVLQEFNISPSGKYIFSPRCLRPVYNQEIVLKSFRIIRERNPDYKLIMLYCEQPNQRYLKALRLLTHRLGIQEDVVWINRTLKEKEMRDVFSFSEVILNIPQSDQLGASLREGIACGCFPIASNLHPYHAVIEDGVNGLFVTPEPDSVADAFDKFIQRRSEFTQRAMENSVKVLEKVDRNDDFLAFIECVSEKLIRMKKA